ncbi:YfcE family phosphodiesterase [Halovenus sp. WSH3]|uniref:Phosphoesterase n=1 Tax=Halovenus carboxidivorans TaxID=2692199 RepID=A0A6B0T0Q5_9EURY|nr:metallophosphoesterase [Halovenus carboxidivorans]MXR51624.1 YfcE family phosphodiesterase [Halovenus carboxidivorans]
MLVAVSDTHRSDDPGLPAPIRSAIEDADVLLHAGDFTTPSVLESFERIAPSLVAVAGNRDVQAVTDRLPATTTTEWAGRRVLLAHGHEHDATALSLLARQEDADLIVTGHTHRPVIDTVGEIPHLNPGSYADPRRYRPAYATIEEAGEQLRISLRSPEGEEFERRLV